VRLSIVKGFTMLVGGPRVRAHCIRLAVKDSVFPGPLIGTALTFVGDKILNPYHGVGQSAGTDAEVLGGGLLGCR